MSKTQAQAQVATFYVDGLSADEKDTIREEWTAKGYKDVRVMQGSFSEARRNGFKFQYRVFVNRRFWIEDVGVPSYDVTAKGIAEILESDHYLKVVVLDWTAPAEDEDAYVLHSVEVEVANG